jgi:hypothetical protein
MQVQDFVQEQRMRAKELLSQHRDKVEALAKELMLKKVRMKGVICTPSLPGRCLSATGTLLWDSNSIDSLAHDLHYP